MEGNSARILIGVADHEHSSGTQSEKCVCVSVCVCVCRGCDTQGDEIYTTPCFKTTDTLQRMNWVSQRSITWTALTLRYIYYAFLKDSDDAHCPSWGIANINHRRNLANNIGRGKAGNRPWIQGTLIYKVVKWGGVGADSHFRLPQRSRWELRSSKLLRG